MADNPGLNSIINDQIGAFLSDPSQLPAEFLEWLPQYLTVNSPALQNSDLVGGTLTPADGAPHNVDFGEAALTFTTSQTSAAHVVAHSLGAVPTVVLATAQGQFVVVEVSSINASTFTLTGFDPAGTLNGSVVVSWIAIS